MRRIHSLLNDERRSSDGQTYLADVVSQIISSRSVDGKTVWPWIAKHLEAESFKFEWSYNRRSSSRGLNKILFAFAVQRIAALDRIIENLAEESGMMKAKNPAEVAGASIAFAEMVKAGEFAPGKRRVIASVFQLHIDNWSPIMPDYYACFGSEWKGWKKRLPLECAELVLPCLVEDWKICEKAQFAEIKALKKKHKLPKRSTPSDLKKEFRKCAEAIFLENTRYDRIEMPEQRQAHFILKFT